MFSAAFSKDDDFIIIYETRSEDDKRQIHVMTGKLITPCMLGTLTNRCELQQDEGARHITTVLK